ncbi:hypothetical protein [Streptomyces sp. NPDC091212]|uniref:hypothetical protein n=1 Tax=Streptomyces sp. NPDC091212 TaxID=3155191 RepID=UPI003433F21A
MTTPIPLPPFEPYTYYQVTARDITPECVNYKNEFTLPSFYSNAGWGTAECGMCGKSMEILTSQILDPQPGEE